MTEEFKQWEYRVQTIGSMFGTKDENIETMLNEWGNEGWEVTHHPKPAGSPVVSTRGGKRVLSHLALAEFLIFEI
jgi:hypothetical protein